LTLVFERLRVFNAEVEGKRADHNARVAVSCR
jgi:hypothetical protein